ncbi:MAG: efflux RND transporter periplasmic adaptor subunit [Epsilonproteobacteria bacterium]|nr:efflux RND transporter periplasmic adaptor subunit [Campylobacterota bacterium]
MRPILLAFFLLFTQLSAAEVYATFTVQALQSAKLAFDAGGVVKGIYADIGQSVKKGELLAELKNDDLKASVQIAKVALENANTLLKYAKRDYDRALKIQNLVNEEQFDKYALAYETAQIRVHEAQANLAYKEAILEKSYLYAPFEGVIFFKDLEIGDVVNGMMLRTVFEIQSPSARKLLLSFDQRYHGAVKKGDSFSYKIDGDERVYGGKILKVYPHANESDRKLSAEIAAENILVGLFGDGTITTK